MGKDLMVIMMRKMYAMRRNFCGEMEIFTSNVNCGVHENQLVRA
jgi:hypothetical protein